MQVGLALPHYDCSFPDGAPATPERVAAYAARAEAAGFDSVWVSDHLFLDLAKYGGPDEPYGTPEALSMLALIAARTSRVRFGSLVLCAPFRTSAVVALAGRTLHEASGGRLELGLGAGWYEAEFVAAGIPFGSTGDRMRHLRRYAGEVRGALDAGGFGGEAQPWSAPAKDRPAVWVGGKGGPVLARIVAEHADGWNTVWRFTDDEYGQRLATLHEACARAGRDPATVRLSVGLYTLLGIDDADVASRFDAMRAAALGGLLDGVSLEDFAAGSLVGTPEVCAERIRRLEAMGVEEVILGMGPVPFSVADDEQIDIAASELLPLVR